MEGVYLCFWIQVVSATKGNQKRSFPSNLDKTDRMVRLVLAVVLAALYFTGTVPGTLGIVFLVLAVVFALTAAVSICPIYLLVGLSTRS